MKVHWDRGQTRSLSEPPVVPEFVGRLLPEVNLCAKVEGNASRVTKAMMNAGNLQLVSEVWAVDRLFVRTDCYGCLKQKQFPQGSIRRRGDHWLLTTKIVRKRRAKWMVTLQRTRHHRVFVRNRSSNKTPHLHLLPMYELRQGQDELINAFALRKSPVEHLALQWRRTTSWQQESMCALFHRYKRRNPRSRVATRNQNKGSHASCRATGWMLRLPMLRTYPTTMSHGA